MGRRRGFMVLLGGVATAAAVIGVIRHLRGSHHGRQVRGGILVGDPAAYDALGHRFLLGSLMA
jgi:hypothetical protein